MGYKTKVRGGRDLDLGKLSDGERYLLEKIERLESETQQLRGQLNRSGAYLTGLGKAPTVAGSATQTIPVPGTTAGMCLLTSLEGPGSTVSIIDHWCEENQIKVVLSADPGTSHTIIYALGCRK